MGYIGVQPTDTYLSIASQQITGNGGATYTLDYSVSNEEDVAVFVNNVRQNVSTYTVSGTSLTLGGTISASDSCWVLFLGRTVGTKTPAVGSVTNAMLQNSSITLDGTSISLGGSANGFGRNIGYVGRLSSNVTLATATDTKLTFATSIRNEGSAYNTSTGVFTAPVAGIYQVNSFVQHEGFSGSFFQFEIWVNGSSTYEFLAPHSGGVSYPSSGISASIYLGLNDYFEIYVRQESGGNKIVYSDRWSHLSANLLTYIG